MRRQAGGFTPIIGPNKNDFKLRHYPRLVGPYVLNGPSARKSTQTGRKNTLEIFLPCFVDEEYSIALAAKLATCSIPLRFCLHASSSELKRATKWQSARCVQAL